MVASDNGRTGSTAARSAARITAGRMPGDGTSDPRPPDLGAPVTNDPRLHLQALADALPADGVATVPVAWLRAILANGSSTASLLESERMLTAEGGVRRLPGNHGDG